MDGGRLEREVLARCDEEELTEEGVRVQGAPQDMLVALLLLQDERKRERHLSV